MSHPGPSRQETSAVTPQDVSSQFQEKPVHPQAGHIHRTVETRFSLKVQLLKNTKDDRATAEGIPAGKCAND